MKKLVVFDLNGTIIKGIRYSWSILWSAIGLDLSLADKRKKAFLDGYISYQEWCKLNCKNFQKGGLTKDKIRDVLHGEKYSITRNFNDAIIKLKNNNFIVAIISGGVDFLLYEMLPNADELFDEIFINKLVFDDESGVLKDIIVTPYDWDSLHKGVLGKFAGIKLICDKYNIALKNTVFVGNDENDFKEMSLLGIKIFYNSDLHDFSILKTIKKHDFVIELQDDLLKVADRIIENKTKDKMEN